MHDLFLSWFLIFLASVCNSYASMIVKFRFNTLGEMQLKPFSAFVRYLLKFFQSFLVLSGIITFLLSPVFWFTALNRVQLSIAIPLQFSMHLLLVLFFSWLVLKEKLTLNKIVGALCIFTSLYFLYKS